MLYLVDGNNVFGQRPGWHRDKEGAQLRLLDELAAISAGGEHAFAVVFDGSPLTQLPDGTRHRKVDVYYARPGSNADDRIVELLNHVKYRNEIDDIIVVTSDRVLAERVRLLGARTIRSGELRRMVEGDGERDSR
jgi:predicted RNA-binding protein with PIN domain